MIVKERVPSSVTRRHYYYSNATAATTPCCFECYKHWFCHDSTCTHGHSQETSSQKEEDEEEEAENDWMFLLLVWRWTALSKMQKPKHKAEARTSKVSSGANCGGRYRHVQLQDAVNSNPNLGFLFFLNLRASLINV